MPASTPACRNNVHVRGSTLATRAIVFVHGFGTDQQAWREVAATFEREWRVVLLDNVGSGGTPPEAFTQHQYLGLERYATDLREVCTELGLEIPVSQIDKELRKLWEQDEARTNASLMNLVVYSEKHGALLENSAIIRNLTREHACRAILVEIDKDEAVPSIRA